jgi:hypothetical protein
VIPPNAELAAINGRLADAVERGESVELILVLRGRVSRAPRPGEWRVRCVGRRSVTFRADAVLAATALGRAAPAPRSGAGRRDRRSEANAGATRSTPS